MSACPFCFARTAEESTRCATCQRDLLDGQGRRLRPVDVAGAQARERQRLRFLALLKAGTVSVAGLAALLPFLHLAATPVLVIGLLVGAHLVVVRFLLLRDTLPLLPLGRRILSRWLGRLLILVVGAPGYALTAIPGVGILAGAATFAGLTAAVHYYADWALREAMAHRKVSLWEKLLLAALAALAVLVVVLLVAFAALVGVLIEKLTGTS